MVNHKILQIKLTSQDYEILAEKAKENRLTKTAYARTILFNNLG